HDLLLLHGPGPRLAGPAPAAHARRGRDRPGPAPGRERADASALAPGKGSPPEQGHAGRARSSEAPRALRSARRLRDAARREGERAVALRLALAELRGARRVHRGAL